jgi:hypothetical protein
MYALTKNRNGEVANFELSQELVCCVTASPLMHMQSSDNEIWGYKCSAGAGTSPTSNPHHYTFTPSYIDLIMQSRTRMARKSTRKAAVSENTPGMVCKGHLTKKSADSNKDNTNRSHQTSEVENDQERSLDMNGMSAASHL